MTRTALAAFILLTACARSEPADQSSVDNPAFANELPASVEPADESREETEGRWQVSGVGPQPAAFIGTTGQVLFALRCDERRGLVVQRPGLIPRSQLALLQLRTGGVVRRLAVTASATGTPNIESVIPYNDELIAPLMRFDEALEVRFTGLEPLILPPSPEVAGFVQGCQSASTSGEGSAPAAAPAVSNASTNGA
jgi:hypothetical protein